MDLLQAAIQQSLGDMRVAGRAPAGGVPAMASEVMSIVEQARDVLSNYGGGKRTDRRIVVLALSVAALDIGWAICHLLKTEPERTHIVTLTLWRSFLEMWLRAIFFALEASDEEVSEFRFADKVPQRATLDGKKQINISIRIMARLVGPLLVPDDRGILDVIADEVDEWHGFVHGGASLVDALDSGTEIKSRVNKYAITLNLHRISANTILLVCAGLQHSRDLYPIDEIKIAVERLADSVKLLQRRWTRPYSGEPSGLTTP